MKKITFLIALFLVITSLESSARPMFPEQSSYRERVERRQERQDRKRIKDEMLASFDTDGDGQLSEEEQANLTAQKEK